MLRVGKNSAYKLLSSNQIQAKQILGLLELRIRTLKTLNIECVFIHVEALKTTSIDINATRASNTKTP